MTEKKTPAVVASNVEAPAAPKPKARKRVSKPTAAKKTTKKASTTPKPKTKATPKAKNPSVEKKAPAAKKTAGAPKTEGLRKPQVRLLETLAKASRPLERKDWAAKAKVDNAACTEYVGSVKEDVRLANDKKHFPSLVSLKLVKMEKTEENGKELVRYAITALGQKKVD